MAADRPANDTAAPRKRRLHICPVCSQPIRQRDARISLAGVRHHLACAPARGPGRPALVAGRKRGSPQLKATVTPEEHTRVLAHVEASGTSVNGLIRERLADVLRGE